jgi:hypothetical protein
MSLGASLGFAFRKASKSVGSENRIALYADKLIPMPLEIGCG